MSIEVLEAEARIEELLDHVVAFALDVPADLREAWLASSSTIRRFVGREPEVVLEEVAVGVDMRHHELLVDHRVAAQQVRVARVVVDHELVDLAEPPLVALR